MSADDKKPVTVRLPYELIRTVKLCALDDRTTVSHWIQVALEEALTRRDATAEVFEGRRRRVIE